MKKIKKFLIYTVALITICMATMISFCGFFNKESVCAETETYIITVQHIGKGSIEITGDYVVEKGSSKTIIVRPDEGYKLVGLFVNDEKVLVINNVYEIKHISQDLVVRAEFGEITFFEKPIFYILLTIAVLLAAVIVFLFVYQKKNKLKKFGTLSGDTIVPEYSGVVQITKIKNKKKKIETNQNIIKNNENQVIDIIKNKMNNKQN